MRLSKIGTVIHGAGKAVLRATLVPCGRTVVAEVDGFPRGGSQTIKVTLGGVRSTDEHLDGLIQDALDKQRILLEGRPDMMF